MARSRVRDRRPPRGNQRRRVRTRRSHVADCRADLRIRRLIGCANVGNAATFAEPDPQGIMTKQIDVETLRDWLEARRPVTVLDIRTDDDRAQWAIPGSLHVNAYEALRNHERGAPPDPALPAGRPVLPGRTPRPVSPTAAAP